MNLKTLSLLLFGFFSPSFLAYACNMHGSVGVPIPQYTNLLTTLSNIANATAQWRLQPLTKSEFQLNVELSGKLHDTKPDFDIIFYQAIEGHYLMVSEDAFQWLQVYTKLQKPTESDVMIISELTVFDAIIEKRMTITEALEDELIVINGPESDKKIVQQWLVKALS